MISREKSRRDRPSKEAKMLLEVLMTFPYTVGYMPTKNLLATSRGPVNIPKKYHEYPLLAIFYVKYLIKKNPYALVPTDLNWPEPYVIMNTIINRLRNHKLFVNSLTDAYVKKLHKAIAPGLRIPESKKDERLGQPKKTQNISKEITENFTDSLNAREKLDQFFAQMQDGSLTRNLEGGLCKVKVIISCKALFENDMQSLNGMAANARKLWVGETVCALVSNTSSIDSNLDDNVDDNNDNDGENNANGNYEEEHTTETQTAPAAPDTVPETSQAQEAEMTKQDFKRTTVTLQNDLEITQQQFHQCSKIATYLKNHEQDYKNFVQQKNTARSHFYLSLKECLGSSWKLRIYRGIRWKKNGQLRASFKTLEYSHISSFWVNIELISRENALDDIILVLTCDVQEKESESDVERDSDTESSQ